MELAQRHQKPVLHLSQQGGPASPERALLGFIRENRIQVLNVAGPRASKEPEVSAFVMAVLDKTWDAANEACPATPATIETDRLVLRPLAPGDAPDVARLAGRREIADTTISIPHPYSEEQARDWIAARTGPSSGSKDIAFAITLKENGRLIGAVGLREIDTEHSQAEMGFWIGVDWWGQGYATEASRAVVRFAFKELNLNRVSQRRAACLKRSA